MGGTQAAKVLVQIQESSLKKQGKVISEEEHQALTEKITQNYTTNQSRIFRF